MEPSTRLLIQLRMSETEYHARNHRAVGFLVLMAGLGVPDIMLFAFGLGVALYNQTTIEDECHRTQEGD